MKVWIDMTASAHPLVYRPLVEIMRGRGDKTLASPPDATRASQVLLVEDEPMITDRIESALRDFSVTTVTEGDAAIQRLENGNYACVLLDLMLPHLSGFDVLRHIMIRRPDLLKRTFIMTAATDESLQFIERDSVGGILRKPFDVGSLPGIVAQAVG